MAEYIEMSDALSEIDEWMESVGTALIGKGLSYYAELQGCIEDCKAADVAPVLHGRWVKRRYKWQCTHCKVLMSIDGTPKENMLNYCPNCGAKMDG